MEKRDESLLVPIKVAALVIEDEVDPEEGILRGALPRNGGAETGDFKWSPQSANYDLVANEFKGAGPEEFYGTQFDPLRVNMEAQPKASDRGVYLHWTLPPSLRRASRPNTFEFPPLPDQWLMVRFARRTRESDETPEVRAWFIDGTEEMDADSRSASFLKIDPKPSAWGNAYISQRLGRVCRLEEVTEYTAPLQERPTLTALGNEYTGSPTFTAFLAENRNVLSWHDELTDLRDAEGRIPPDTALSYLVVGWHRDPKHDPLAALNSKPPGQADFKKALDDILSGLDWKCDAVPEPLSEVRCLYHATVAQIHYWNPRLYGGPMLGYPGAPPAHSQPMTAPSSIAVAIGNTAEDALVALVGSKVQDKGPKELWKALEAVIYRQAETLLKKGDDKEWGDEWRERMVHRSSFASHDAGTTWSIVARDPDPMHGGVAGESLPTQSPKPTQEQLATLHALNQAQARVDSLAREVVALQHDFYTVWWKVCRDEVLGKRGERPTFQVLLDALRRLGGKLDEQLGPDKELRLRRAELESRLEGSPLELSANPAPRFWKPTDPVIVIQNLGEATQQSFPNPLSCRFSSATASLARVRGDGAQPAREAALGPADAILQLQDTLEVFGRLSSTLTLLMQEASVVERAIAQFIAWHPPRSSRGEDWGQWLQQIAGSLSKRTDDDRSVCFFSRAGERVEAEQLFVLWGRQPWCPLFLDWRVTWHPLAPADNSFQFTGRDYHPIPRMGMESEGHIASGRSLLAPFSGRFFSEPLRELRELLKGPSTAPAQSETEQSGQPERQALEKELAQFQTVWDKTLRELEAAPLVGQALSGLHQFFLGRDVKLPRVRPNSQHPWNPRKEVPEAEVARVLMPPVGLEGLPPIARPELAPPGGDPTQLSKDEPQDSAFDPYRAGWFTVDQLWLVDGFGQWADLLGGSSCCPSMTLQLHPRLRWPGHEPQARIAMPPRIVQPTRLEFDLVPTAASSGEATNPICGWIYHHSLDHALAVCDQDGRLLGELAVTQDAGATRSVSWESLASPHPIAVDQIPDLELRAFVLGLREEAVVGPTKLESLLELIQATLDRRSESSAPRGDVLLVQPLALVKARVGLELFGQPWRDWRMPPGDRNADAPSVLQTLRVPVVLGDPDGGQDGLVGYYRSWPDALASSPAAFDRIIPAPTLRGTGSYIANPLRDAPHVGLGAPALLTLLLDPRGSVLASSGLLPAKPLTVAADHIEAGISHMEVSFRVGPILSQPGPGGIPVQASPASEWFFQGGEPGAQPRVLAPFDPRPKFGPEPRVATEGRLIRRKLDRATAAPSNPAETKAT